MEVKKNIIFGVLNWGLGHATRSVPIIQEIIDQGYNPIIASDGSALSYLKKEFPQLKWEEIVSYKVNYKFENLFFQSLFLAPKISSAIAKEQKQVKFLVKKYKAIAVIADNRLGFYSKKVPSAYISHQNKIIAPFPFSLANNIHYHFIQKFSEFWIPDFEAFPGLSGKLGHRKNKNQSVKYIGPLSRFSNYNNEKRDTVYDLTTILSGPEPQRSLLEKKILSQLKTMNGKFLVIRGKQDGTPLENYENIDIKTMVYGEELPKLIEKSKLILSRSGYSSIMDYYFLKNKALLIPTPGQSEQIYLAQKLKEDGLFYSVNQKEMELNIDLNKALQFPGFKKNLDLEKDLLEGVLLRFLQGEGKGGT